jgi:alpha-galactosidase
MKKIILLLFLLFPFLVFSQKFENLAKTPPMGWNTWNRFSCDVSEKLIKEAADAMVTSGMKDAGYQYIVIDDCWQGERDSLGFIHPDPKRFPSGIKALAAYVHSLGLKFGIYSDAGWKTCGGKPGSRGYEFQDALTYAQWDVDYLKYDWCYTEQLSGPGAYLTMNRALFAAHHPIVFSLCEWGTSKPWEWAKDIGHLWRTTGDITPFFDSLVNHGDWSSLGVMQILDLQAGLRKYAGPGHWNDPDMLEVGNGMSVNEDRAHFSMWCMLAAPLIAGNDLFRMSPETKEILTNKEVIAVNQDTLGVEGLKFATEGNLESWAKPLSNDEWALCILNRGKTEASFKFSREAISVHDSVAGRVLSFKDKQYKMRNLWAHQETGTTGKDFSVMIPARDVLLLRLTPVK